jgi:hypothetical protein
MNLKMPSIPARGLAAVALALAALVTSAGAQAGLVNIDFNEGTAGPTYSGAAVVGSAGDVWNGISAGTLGTGTSGNNLSLIDAGGANSGVTLSFTQTSGAFNTGSGCLMSAASTAALMCDYLYVASTAPAVKVTFAGLTPGSLFDLILYSMANDPGRVTDFTLDSTTQSVTAAAGNNLVQGTNYARFSGTVGAGGELAFTTAAGQRQDIGLAEGNLDGIQLTQTPAQVPEPASAALVLVALAAAVGVRRRQRQQV